MPIQFPPAQGYSQPFHFIPVGAPHLLVHPQMRPRLCDIQQMAVLNQAMWRGTPFHSWYLHNMWTQPSLVPWIAHVMRTRPSFVPFYTYDSRLQLRTAQYPLQRGSTVSSPVSRKTENSHNTQNTAADTLSPQLRPVQASVAQNNSMEVNDSIAGRQTIFMLNV